MAKKEKAVNEPQQTLEPTKQSLKKAISSGSMKVKQNLKKYAKLMDDLLDQADKLDELKEKQEVLPKNRSLAKAVEKADLGYQKIDAAINEKEAFLDNAISELARNYYALSDFAKNEKEKNKICENGKNTVQNFENLKADIEGRVKSQKPVGDVDFYLNRKEDEDSAAQDDGQNDFDYEKNATEEDNDMNDWKSYQNEMDNRRIDALSDEVRRLTTMIADMKDKGPAQPPFGYPYPPERPSYRVAPVTIDISREVSRAVENAMDKFNAAFENKINEYVASLPAFVSGANTDFDITEVVNEALQSMAENVDAKIAVIAEKVEEVTEVASAAASNNNVANMEAFGHAYQLSEQVSDDENFIMNKLTAMLENVKALNDKMLELSAAQMEIAEKQKEIIDLQRQTNDVQRYTLREQEGVQVNQKVIGKDQIAIVEQQAVIAEEQKNIAGIQADILESQKVTAVDQKTVLDVQTTVENAMKDIVKEQDNLNNNQREILKGNAQNYDIQQEIASLQVEITNAQKDVIGGQKQLLRDQKAVVEKQKANNDLQAEINEDLKNLTKNAKALADSLAKSSAKKAKKETPVTEG